MSAIPTTMKSVFIREAGGVENLNYEDVPIPKVTEDSVLVKNHFSGKEKKRKTIVYVAYFKLTRLNRYQLYRHISKKWTL